MTSQKQSFPSFASVISLLSIALYCAAFLRVEFELSKHMKRINVLEKAAELHSSTEGSTLSRPTKNSPGKLFPSAVNFQSPGTRCWSALSN